jgi:hypothetical protein
MSRECGNCGLGVNWLLAGLQRVIHAIVYAEGFSPTPVGTQAHVVLVAGRIYSTPGSTPVRTGGQQSRNSRSNDD